MLERVYAVWFIDYDNQDIVGNLYRNRSIAEEECARLNSQPYSRGMYSVQEHIIE